MKYIFSILVIWGISSCSLDYNYDYRIRQLPHRDLSYEELPDSVRSFIYAESISQEVIISELLFVDSIESSNYHLESVEVWFGPWIDYFKLIDSNKNIKYRIEYSDNRPYIVWHHKLYIPIPAPGRYETNTLEDLKLATYTEYELCPNQWELNLIVIIVCCIMTMLILIMKRKAAKNQVNQGTPIRSKHKHE